MNTAISCGSIRLNRSLPRAWSRRRKRRFPTPISSGGPSNNKLSPFWDIAPGGEFANLLGIERGLEFEVEVLRSAAGLRDRRENPQAPSRCASPWRAFHTRRPSRGREEPLSYRVRHQGL